ncbi:MAG: hypothetical protein Q9201_004971 [Fulgogasparrea decipioides]
MAPQRSLTLTEELEKLEQSITLTLQEIDHNFSRAHRIVTTSILPVVEQYAEHSKNVWESSKFWKQFFEASANVSLSGYEEPPEQDETVTGDDATATTPSTSAYASSSQSHNDETMTPQSNNQQQYPPSADDSTLSTIPPEQSTPRPRSQRHQGHHQQPPSMALYTSPYEALKREIKGQQPLSQDDNSALPSTPRNPLQNQHTYPPSTSHPHRTPKDDPLLHRILDKNWRLQATPHATTRAPKPGSSIKLPYRSGRTPARRKENEETPAAAGKGKARAGVMDDDRELDSSPTVPAPELHSEIFGTPAAAGRRKQVPGVSVLTPARGKKGMTPMRKPSDKTSGKDVVKDIWDSDSDDDDSEGLAGGMSPPKTMQFHVPQSRLLRTPAREASKKIVQDLLLTAGGNVTDEFEDESSPSVVKRAGMEEDDTF